MNQPLHLRIIVFYSEGLWIAQCLEHDICVETKDFHSLQTLMEAALRVEQNAHRAGGQRGLEGLPPSPPLFLQMWNERSIFNELGKAAGVNYEMALYVEPFSPADSAVSAPVE